MSDLKRTPLFDEHQRLGGKMVPFAGFEMPIQYPTGILTEHQAVRRRAGLFDVSHMGEVEIRGPQALDFVQRVTTNDASQIVPGQAQYSVLCNADGGVIDDCLVYRFDDHYMIVVNASNRARDMAWFERHAGEFDIHLLDRSDETALLALQGPGATRILAGLTDATLDEIRYYHFAVGSVAGARAVISRTGYTGEDGFELYLSNHDAVGVWRAVLDAGGDAGLVPVGLGARDSLRLEVGFLLHGNDMDETRTPLEAGLGWVVKLDKGDFIGRNALARQKAEGVAERLTGVQLDERGLPRRGYALRIDGEQVGSFTSGGHSPMLEKGVGLAYVRADVAKTGTAVEVVIRDRGIPATLMRPPFYKDGSVRNK
jgi:aminomethyltransferase